MSLVSLPAHFDGQHIVLDEAFDIAPDAKLLVTVLEPKDDERADWLHFLHQNLERAYGDNEPDYDLDSVANRFFPRVTSAG